MYDESNLNEVSPPENLSIMKLPPSEVTPSSWGSKCCSYICKYNCEWDANMKFQLGRHLFFLLLTIF